LPQALESDLEVVSSRVNLMDMRAPWTPVIKFSVDGFGLHLAGDFDAVRAPVAPVSCRQKACDLGDGVERLPVSNVHWSSPGGRPGAALWMADPRVGASLRLPAMVVRHPQRFPLGGLPAVWWF
jgi:hypothetical protein